MPFQTTCTSSERKPKRRCANALPESVLATTPARESPGEPVRQPLVPRDLVVVAALGVEHRDAGAERRHARVDVAVEEKAVDDVRPPVVDRRRRRQSTAGSSLARFWSTITVTARACELAFARHVVVQRVDRDVVAVPAELPRELDHLLLGAAESRGR